MLFSSKISLTIFLTSLENYDVTIFDLVVDAGFPAAYGQLLTSLIASSLRTVRIDAPVARDVLSAILHKGTCLPLSRSCWKYWRTRHINYVRDRSYFRGRKKNQIIRVRCLALHFQHPWWWRLPQVASSWDLYRKISMSITRRMKRWCIYSTFFCSQFYGTVINWTVTELRHPLGSLKTSFSSIVLAGGVQTWCYVAILRNFESLN